MDKKGTYIYEWPRPMVTVDAVVFSKIGGIWKLLLIKRANPPYAGKWAVPGGFIGIDEELDDAAARELAEETGLGGIKLEQMQTFGTCGRDPRGRQITVVFVGVADERAADKAAGGDDASDAKWFDIENLPTLAFDHDRVADFAVGVLAQRGVL